MRLTITEVSGPGGTRLLPLAGRVAVVTGVSRRAGIGFAIVRRLVDDGAAVFATGWPAHDAERPWGADPDQSDLFPSHDDVFYRPVDLADREGPRQVIEGATATFGAVDILVANHARSSSQALTALTAGELDLAWAVNTRATLLLVQTFARCHNDERCGGRVVLFTSGQHLAPMPGELPYVATKGAIHQVTATLADELADRGITVNCVNPGPVDTGYATGEQHQRVAGRFPSGQWGSPADTARLVSWLVSDEAAWLTGQVINSEGGFRR